MCFKDHGVDYEAFKAALPTLAMDAYEDQCTPANPRLALIKDMEGIMEAAWFGFDEKKIRRKSIKLFIKNIETLNSYFLSSEK